MEISLAYQGKQISLARPENYYQSNLEAFGELLKLALEGVGLSITNQGALQELPTPQPPEIGFTANK